LAAAAARPLAAVAARPLAAVAAQWSVAVAKQLEDRAVAGPGGFPTPPEERPAPGEPSHRPGPAQPTVNARTVTVSAAPASAGTPTKKCVEGPAQTSNTTIIPAAIATIVAQQQRHAATTAPASAIARPAVGAGPGVRKATAEPRAMAAHL
jgi:hypothetical protein